MLTIKPFCKSLAAALIIINLVSCSNDNEPRQPLKEIQENSLTYTWPFKKVYDSLLIDDMESRSGWQSSLSQTYSGGAQTSGKGTYSYTTERSVDGSTSLRLTYPFKDTAFIASAVRRSGVFHGDCNRVILASLNFKEPQDWTIFNRISLWVYVHPESDGVQDRLRLMFDCADKPSSPLVTSQAYNNFHTMKAGQWNHIFWEIPELPRHKVTRLSFQFPVVGHRFGKEGIAVFDIDKLQLERVDINKNEGWPVSPGKISFSHTGYYTGGSKIAATCTDADVFQLINDKGEIVLSKPVKPEQNDRGLYRLLDFSEVTSEGTYRLKAGTIITRPFRISNEIWRTPIEKALNFFYVERCGYHVPGVHAVCHEDWQGIYNGEKKVINGGWHDAGDLCQGIHQTGYSVYAMLELAAQLSARGNDPLLKRLAEEEAEWGLGYLLKNRFADGYKVNWSTMRIYTDNKTGTIDDVITPARNVPWINFMTSGIGASAYKHFMNSKPDLAQKCLDAAKDDWMSAMAGLPQGWDDPDSVISARLDPLKLASWGTVASLHLYNITGDVKYSETAVKFGRIVTACQETSFIEGIPITGYFYYTPERNSIIHYIHFGFEETPIMALTSLCNALPDHKDWIKWYAAVVMHSEYFMKRGARYSSPFYMLPASIYSKQELLDKNKAFISNISGDPGGRGRLDEATRDALMKQIEEGTQLSDNYYIRRFPVQTSPNFHGSTAIQLSESAALAMAYRLRNDPEGAELVNKQMEWVLGKNPFSQSLMYGEGYDYTPLFSSAAGNIVGALPVGMDCMSNDEPFWYGSNNQTTKEVWVVPTGRFLWNMAYIGTPALVEGRIIGDRSEQVKLTNKSTGEVQYLKTDTENCFSQLVQPGDYRIEFGQGYADLSALNGCSYSINCDQNNFLVFDAVIDSGQVDPRVVRALIKAEGKGSHSFKVLCFNGELPDEVLQADLTPGNKKELTLTIKITDINKPWVVVIIPDNDITKKVELTGETIKSIK